MEVKVGTHVGAGRCLMTSLVIMNLCVVKSGIIGCCSSPICLVSDHFPDCNVVEFTVIFVNMPGAYRANSTRRKM